MVAFSTVARMLEENASAAAVYELSRQIQGFFNRALAQLPDTSAYSVVSKPGDGIILLFDTPDDAHCFGWNVHQIAAEHNCERNVDNAKRWFRIGIATGDVVITDTQDSPAEYAGIAIANAVRLESSAKAGEIIVDVATFAALSSEYQSTYGPEEVVSGKRDERFKARRSCVIQSDCSEIIARPARLTRRAVVGGGAIALGAAAAGGALWDRSWMEDMMHPLPPKRFVAVMGWPAPADKRLEPTVQSVVDAIGSELARAEAYDRNLYVIPQRMNASITSMAQLNDLRTAVGANLVLAISAMSQLDSMDLSLRILDTAASKVLRQRNLSFGPGNQISVAGNAVQTARRLLNAPSIKPPHSETGRRNKQSRGVYSVPECGEGTHPRE